MVVVLVVISTVLLFIKRNCADFNTQSLGRNFLMALEETAAGGAAASASNR